MFELGINSNNECGQGAKEAFDLIKKVGFTNVMVAAKEGQFEQNIKECLDCGLKIPYVHLNTKFANDLWVVGEANDELVKEKIEEIKICSKYNIPIAIMHVNQGDPSSLPIKPNKNGIKAFLKILEVAQKENVKIALENIDVRSIANLTYLLEKIKSEHLGLCFDVGHYNLYTPKAGLLKRYKNRVFAVHIHDNLMDWKYGYDYTRDLHMLPFDGKIKFDKFCLELSRTCYKGVIMLEVHRIGLGEPRIYRELSCVDFLSEAYKRAVSLKTKLEAFMK